MAAKKAARVGEKRRAEVALQSGKVFLRDVLIEAEAKLQQDTAATSAPENPCQSKISEDVSSNNSAPTIEDDPEDCAGAYSQPEAATPRENNGAPAEDILNNGVNNLNLEDLFQNLSSESENEDDTLNFNSNYQDFKLELQELVINQNLSNQTTSKLLKLLNKHNLIPRDSSCPEKQEEIKLPNDARTFLGTPRDKIKVKAFPITDKSNKRGAEYIYFGLKKPLLERLKHARKLPNKIKLKFNIDGLPLGEGRLQFWPILCVCSNIDDSLPFVVGLYCGYEKPCDTNLFLEEFVIELKEIIRQKYHVNGVTCEFEIECFICDAPARAAILGIYQYNGTKGCGKCMVEGPEFLESNCPLRTNANFRNRVDKDHHKWRSILGDIVDLDMVKCFPVDYMHCVLLGVVKKLLKLWTGKSKGEKKTFKFSKKDIAKIDRFLVSYRKRVPREINRRPTSINDCTDWKATEFRTFLLYLGPVVLKSILPPDYYNHFMSLSVAIRILVSPELIKDQQKMEYADILLRHFVNTYASYYGKHNMVYNVHNCIHLVNDCKELGTLDSFSSFPFENYLGYMKRHYLRTNVKPLQQVCKRLVEIENFKTKICSSRKKNSSLNCTFTLLTADRFALLKDKRVVKIVHIDASKPEEFIVLVASEISSFSNDFGGLLTYNIGICCFDNSARIRIRKADIAAKLFVLPLTCERSVFLPLIHTEKV